MSDEKKRVRAAQAPTLIGTIMVAFLVLSTQGASNAASDAGFFEGALNGLMMLANFVRKFFFGHQIDLVYWSAGRSYDWGFGLGLSSFVGVIEQLNGLGIQRALLGYKPPAETYFAVVAALVMLVVVGGLTALFANFACVNPPIVPAEEIPPLLWGLLSGETRRMLTHGSAGFLLALSVTAFASLVWTAIEDLR